MRPFWMKFWTSSRVAARRGRRNRRGVKRKMSSFPLRANGPPLAPIPDIREHIRILK